MKKRILTFIVFFALLTSIVFAQNAIVLGKQTQEAVISPLGEAKFTVKVTNSQNVDDIFVLELSDVAWSLRAADTPDVTTGIMLDPGESKTSLLYMKPSENAAEGTHYLELRVKSTNTGKYTSELFVVKVDPKVVDYSIKIPVDVLETSIDPARTNSVKVLIKNPYPVYLQNISVSASSKFLNKNVVVEISPKSEKIIDFSLNIDSSTPKQEDIMGVSVKQLGKEIGSAKETLSIKEYKLPYKQDLSAEKGFLSTIYRYTFTNTEKAQKTQDIMVEKISTFGLLTTNPVAEAAVFDNKDYFLWKAVALKPDETHNVVIVKDYRQFAVGILVIILIIILYYAFRSPIIVAKRGYGLHKKDTGNNEIKVVLHIKNRSRRFIEKVRVLERLPIIHRVEPDFGPETPEPKFRRSHDGIMLDWDISLAPKEERVFTYKIKSTLPIVGEYTLRPCVVQYGHKAKRTSSAPYRLVID